MGKQILLRQFGYLPRTFAATDEALQVVQMFSGDGGKISDIGDDDSDAGAGEGAIDQMIMPIAVVWSRFLREKPTAIITMMIINSMISRISSSTIICNNLLI